MPSNSNNKTTVLETRIDIRIIASLAQYYIKKHNIPISSKSQLIRIALEDYTSFLKERGKLDIVEKTTDAIAILEVLGLGSSSKDSRNRLTLLEQLTKEEETEEDSSFNRSVQEALLEIGKKEEG